MNSRFVDNLGSSVMMRGGMALLGGATLVTLIFLFIPYEMYLVLGIGAVIVGLLIAGYVWVLGRIRKRKAAPLERDLRSNTSAAPQAVAEPARRARLDELRKKFEDGLGKFKAAGKSLYDLPWFVIVGESGSGKTEAIRHSNVGFPPGLQDGFQGAGGTINMDWWFTSQAVILDTAGRMLFDEVDTTSTSEWKQLLAMLKKHRPNCPVNGMLLVIPADSLIRDTPDQIDRKAGKIAQQLDLIQRTLDVRFPVFVVISKCDLFYGFREFFENIDDLQARHQILGWSSPDPLDERFHPEQIEAHFATVLNRLRRRRLAVMLDPVHTESPSGRRLDEVDALYGLPQSLERAVPRLRRYLELIFVGNEWSTKPAFLRGIYLTSSMREGSALDAELAEILGVSVETLLEGRVWSHDKAYFLRDVFLEKTFRETGLVTRASNASREHRKRKLAVLGAGVASVLLLGIFTWLGYRSFQASVGAHQKFWKETAQRSNWMPLSDRMGEGDGPRYWRPVIFKESDRWKYHETTVRKHEEAVELAKNPPRIPRIFGLASIGGNFTEEIPQVQRLLYESSVLRPSVHAARQTLVSSRAGSARMRQNALVQLLCLEALREGVDTPALTEQGREPRVGDLIGFILQADNPPASDSRPPGGPGDAGAPAAKTMDFSDLDKLTHDSWPHDSPPQLKRALDDLHVGEKASQAAVLAGLAILVDQLHHGSGPAQGRLERITEIRDLLDGLNDVEKRLLETYDRFRVPPATTWSGPSTVRGFNEARQEYDARWKAFETIARTLSDKLASAKPDYALPKAYEEWCAERKTEASASCQKIRDAASPHKDKLILKRVNDYLDAALIRLQRELMPEELLAEMKNLQARFLDSVPEAVARGLAEPALRDELLANRHYFGIRRQMYLQAASELAYSTDPAVLKAAPAAAPAASASVLSRPDSETQSLAPLSELRAGMQQIELRIGTSFAADRAGACGRIRTLAALAPSAYRFDEASRFSQITCSLLAKRMCQYRRLVSAVDRVPETPEKIKDAVAQRAEKLWTISDVPFTGFAKATSVDKNFDPAVAEAVARELQDLGEIVRPRPPAAPAASFAPPLDQEELAKAFDRKKAGYEQYVREYAAYWIGLAEKVKIDPTQLSTTWPKVRERELATDVQQVNERAKGVCELLHKGLYPLAAKDAPLCVFVGKDEPLLKSAEEKLGMVAKGREKAASLDFSKDCRAVMNAWWDLGQDVDVVRKNILGKAPSDFRPNGRYLIYPAADAKNCVEEYWAALTFHLLKTLADDVVRQGRDQIAALKNFSAFPLALPAEGPGELTIQQLAEARRVVDRITAAIERRPGGGETIDAGGTTGMKQVDEQINRLRYYDLSEQERLIVKKRRAVLDGLAEIQCQTAVKALPNQWSAVWGGGVEVWQGNNLIDGQANKVQFAQPDPVELRFFRWVANKPNPDIRLAIVGPGNTAAWSCLRLLHPGKAQTEVKGMIADKEVKEKRAVSWTARMVEDPTAVRDPADPGAQPVKTSKAWEVEFEVPNPPPAQGVEKMVLELKFSKPLPGPGYWPSVEDFQGQANPGP